MVWYLYTVHFIPFYHLLDKCGTWAEYDEEMDAAYFGRWVRYSRPSMALEISS
jgi:hypothetical protein